MYVSYIYIYMAFTNVRMCFKFLILPNKINYNFKYNYDPIKLINILISFFF